MNKTLALAGLIGATLFGQQPPYLDPNLPPERRAADIVSRMTLEEKVGQLNQYFDGGEFDPEVIRRGDADARMRAGQGTATVCPRGWRLASAAPILSRSVTVIPLKLSSSSTNAVSP